MTGTTATRIAKGNGAKEGEPVHRPPITGLCPSLGAQDRMLLRSLCEERVEYVHHELFDKESCERVLFGSVAVLEPRATSFEEDAAHNPVNDHEEGTLSTAQEVLLFQRFNYTRMKMVNLLTRYSGKPMPAAKVNELLAWAHRAQADRARIVQANMPLVLAMSKRTRLHSLDFNEMVSEGNLALLRSVDKFDCSRGFKFSTYACRAILKSFSRVALRTSRYRGRFPTEFDPSMEKSDFVERKRDDVEGECVDEIREILAENRASLSDVERTVICERFALNAPTLPAKGKTLEQVGEIIGVTKERVRQIQNKALAKIRVFMEEHYLAA